MKECDEKKEEAAGAASSFAWLRLVWVKMHGLIKNKRAGKEVHYSMAENDRARLAHQMLDDCFHMSCPGGYSASLTR